MFSFSLSFYSNKISINQSNRQINKKNDFNSKKDLKFDLIWFIDKYLMEIKLK